MSFAKGQRRDSNIPRIPNRSTSPTKVQRNRSPNTALSSSGPSKDTPDVEKRSIRRSGSQTIGPILSSTAKGRTSPQGSTSSDSPKRRPQKATPVSAYPLPQVVGDQYADSLDSGSSRRVDDEQFGMIGGPPLSTLIESEPLDFSSASKSLQGQPSQEASMQPSAIQQPADTRTQAVASASLASSPPASHASLGQELLYASIELNQSLAQKTQLLERQGQLVKEIAGQTYFGTGSSTASADDLARQVEWPVEWHIERGRQLAQDLNAVCQWADEATKLQRSVCQVLVTAMQAQPPVSQEAHQTLVKLVTFPTCPSVKSFLGQQKNSGGETWNTAGELSNSQDLRLEVEHRLELLEGEVRASNSEQSTRKMRALEDRADKAELRAKELVESIRFIVKLVPDGERLSEDQLAEKLHAMLKESKSSTQQMGMLQAQLQEKDAELLRLRAALENEVQKSGDLHATLNNGEEVAPHLPSPPARPPRSSPPRSPSVSTEDSSSTLLLSKKSDIPQKANVFDSRPNGREKVVRLADYFTVVQINGNTSPIPEDKFRTLGGDAGVEHDDVDVLPDKYLASEGMLARRRLALSAEGKEGPRNEKALEQSSKGINGLIRELRVANLIDKIKSVENCAKLFVVRLASSAASLFGHGPLPPELASLAVLADELDMTSFDGLAGCTTEEDFAFLQEQAKIAEGIAQELVPRLTAVASAAFEDGELPPEIRDLQETAVQLDFASRASEETLKPAPSPIPPFPDPALQPLDCAPHASTAELTSAHACEDFEGVVLPPVTLDLEETTQQSGIEKIGPTRELVKPPAVDGRMFPFGEGFLEDVPAKTLLAPVSSPASFVYTDATPPYSVSPPKPGPIALRGASPTPSSPSGFMRPMEAVPVRARVIHSAAMASAEVQSTVSPVLSVVSSNVSSPKLVTRSVSAVSSRPARLTSPGRMASPSFTKFRHASTAPVWETERLAQQCICGNIFMADAIYCRKCGVKRPTEVIRGGTPSGSAQIAFQTPTSSSITSSRSALVNRQESYDRMAATTPPCSMTPPVAIGSASVPRVLPQSFTANGAHVANGSFQFPIGSATATLNTSTSSVSTVGRAARLEYAPPQVSPTVSHRDVNIPGFGPAFTIH